MYNGTTDGHGSFSGNPSPEVNYLLDVRPGSPIVPPVTVDLEVCSEQKSNFPISFTFSDGCPDLNRDAKDNTSSSALFNATTLNARGPGLNSACIRLRVDIYEQGIVAAGFDYLEVRG